MLCSVSTISGVSGNSITSEYCTAQKSAFGDQDIFSQKGGLSGMSTALSQGMVLVLSRMLPLLIGIRISG